MIDKNGDGVITLDEMQQWCTRDESKDYHQLVQIDRNLPCHLRSYSDYELQNMDAAIVCFKTSRISLKRYRDELAPSFPKFLRPPLCLVQEI